MKKLIIVILMLCSLTAHAGFKGGVDLERSTYQTNKTFVCKDNGATCRGLLVAVLAISRPRGYIGYEYDLNGNLGVDTNLSLSCTTDDARIDANLIYRVSDRVAVKAGPNVLYNLLELDSGSAEGSYSSAPGYQLGINYKASDKIIITGQLTKSTQYISFKGYSDKIQLDTQSIGLGVRFNF